MRYRLQRKEQHVQPNILGNHSFPIYSYRWKDIAAADSKEDLEEYQANNGLTGDGYRIIDTKEALNDGKDRSI